MDCAELQRFIHAYLDGEFADEDRIACAAHLAGCERCGRIARFEEAFLARVRGATSADTTTPAAVRTRIVRALDEVDRPERARFWGMRLVPLAAGVAAIALSVGAWRRHASEATLSELAEASITSHRQRLPLDVQDSRLESIQRYFSDKVPFAVRPPRFPRAHAKLVGARLGHLRQHQAAKLQYQVDGKPVTVFVLDSGAMPEGIPDARQRGSHLVSHGAHGYQVVMFRSGGTGYAVASEMDPRRLIRLVGDQR